MICEECHINEATVEFSLPIVTIDGEGRHTDQMSSIDLKMCQQCYDELHAC